ncbi:helix-turn-helix protein [Streptomyces sp. VMFN-G11Ma]|nr:helix-turn-helix protein [Streptomyces sp. VMFN-G11Ma]
MVVMARDNHGRAAELLTVRQVLDELGGISRRTFYRWRELRIAPACIRLPNGELRVRRDVLNDWLEDRAERAAS